MASSRRLKAGASALIQEFLVLNRKRLRSDSEFSLDDHRRWSELRGQIEQAVSGSAPGNAARRKALRVPSELRAECSDSRASGQCSAREISEAGVFLAADRPFPVGTPVRVRLTGDTGEAVAIEGAVVWVRPPGSDRGPAGMGIEFLKLDDSQRRAVAYLVEEALAGL
jgi:uncharacterized protein (TIGR02266 family)